MGCVWVYMQKMELRYWWEYGDEKTRINEWNEKRSLIPLLPFKNSLEKPERSTFSDPSFLSPAENLPTLIQ